MMPSLPTPFLWLLALSLTASSAMAQAPAGPAVADVEAVTDTLFGTPVVDNYRWMEDRNGPRFVAWARSQASHARATLDRIPGRDALQDRVAARTAGGVLISRVQKAGGRLFYLKRSPGDNLGKLYMRQGLQGTERLLLDPGAIRQGDTHFSLDYYAPSPDGSKVAYGISPGGSEASVIHILDLASGTESAETIDRAEQGSPSWLPDSRAFFYNRYAKTAPGAPETDKYLNSRALLHVVGTDPEQDRVLAGTGVPGSPPLSPVDTPFIGASAGSAHAVLTVSHGAAPAVTVYVAPLAAVARGSARWKRVATADDAVTDYAIRGHRLFLLTHHGAPRYAVVEVDARRPDLARARVVVRTGTRVVQGIAMASDALFVVDLDGGVNRLRRFDLASGRLSDLQLPWSGSLGSMATDGRQPGAVFGMTSWVIAPQYFQIQGRQVLPVALAPPWREDLGAYVAEETTARAADGTLIPLSIIHRKGLLRDGSHPVWLTAYGAYGHAVMPGLVSRFLPLLDDGGVYAVAHVRGGGEFGEDWHQAGRGATKPNTHLDLIACAEALVSLGYGKPATLAIEGRSAGGIAVGMATTARPELFRVVFNGVGDNNPLRSEFGTDGPANALEYGSIATEAGFRALLAIDATQHVQPGVDYPAVLLSTGMNDPRVAPWQPGKMAAHLQAATHSQRPVLLLVDFNAGHGMGSTKAQRDQEMADQMAFFYWQIGRPGYQPAP